MGHIRNGRWLLFLFFGTFVSGLLPDLECPEDCDCHYFRVNWVTDCSDLGLNSVPTLEEGLSLKVYILNLNGNNLTSVGNFPEGVTLRSVTIADNSLTTVGRNDFERLAYLLDLDLSGNQITTIDPDAFMDNPGLITLELQNNPLDEVEGPFLNSKSILNLDLSRCGISKLNSVFFSELPSLSNLDLSENPLMKLTSGMFSQLPNLRELRLKNCKLKSIEEQSFVKLEDLKWLDLAGNELVSPINWPAVFEPLSQIEYLDLRNSRISNLPDDSFDRNSWLRSLIMAENELRDFDVATTLGQNLKHLDFLDLSDCRISGPLSAKAFANATKLRTLILNGNPISAGDLAVALSPLGKLQKLSLRNCSLTRLPPDTFHRFPNLQELDISRNPLNDVFTAILSPLKSLVHLDMGYSNLASISKTTFHKMTSLKTLILSGNPLKKIESGLFQNLTDLETLELNNCGLSSLNETVFHEMSSYPDLKELRLSGNPIAIPKNGSFLPSQLNRLQILDLSDCNISYIPPNAFENFKKITSLYLKRNRLEFTSTSSLDFLQALPALETLDLSFNNMTSVTPYTFRFNEGLKRLKLVGNPWVCGCNIADMWEWAQVTRGDLNLLVGSVVSSEDIIRPSSKKKTPLFCYIDSKATPVRLSMRRREFVFNVNRTWSRYVRESACDTTRKITPAKLTDVKPEEYEFFHLSMSTWAWSATIASSSTVTIIMILAASSFRNRRA
ncbi:leucine-rich repeat-containing G-protein coupled receptor 4-like [Cimex lectularius]|uniref:Uncharacterized protein n=1 Tax=Cimex lectularius TaxID=79782 RepID=A0A8I6S028_CIMLE|nr:leucine-rich repeat-containing G-protein coupled receptor 4-like [Cimex lectularius]XP_014255660.1 leucine-rich repeat-containing G-protein coupled receptor 4-like [Cimex lectularius]XP_014255668.1 leucine-rich repeat-containing G-protein coupled receptor 4-like [Cimex lectularius]